MRAPRALPQADSFFTALLPSPTRQDDGNNAAETFRCFDPAATARLRRVEMWRGDFRREHICFRPFHLAVP
jgi:hypothetical protein